ncbi:hypothetical protein F9L33_10490 [Amylibacter sp. SFDW26]|uniref:multiheme c-type cytochrome n=1 Tax=Amylibacter sp. SFDW26 TaxID=2652722 RepID=UPI0012629907|nr:hypothetical protein [Amylibacter sp. SFDW26]KAB7613789.1 hypothetical protein F9L33_10490 [Amylibacter sp. SFDW26]
MAKKVSLQRLRLFALIAAIPVVLLGGAVLLTDTGKPLVAHGPIQAGHENTDCSGCHAPSAGSYRQQIQANILYALGQRETPADFGYAPVTSAQCLACHERKNERHPIYRFREPRFVKALETVEASSCLGCHSEHADQRVFVEPEFCQACHADLNVKNDPIDVPHKTLLADKSWGTCLGCHDFHGNHPVKAPLTLKAAHSLDDIRAYLNAGPSPYGDVKTYKAKENE